MADSKTEILGYFTNRIKTAKEQQLTELDLSVPYSIYVSTAHPNDQLAHIPNEVFELRQLEKLVLNNNSLTEVPESITKLTNLTQLDLSANALTEIPESITKLTNLTEL